MTDQELDRLLYAHAGAARDLVLAQLPPEGELPDIPTSPRFQRRMKALIRRADRPGWAKAALRCARQAAVILLVCGTLTFSGLMVTSQAFRTQVIAVITQVFQEFTEFRFSAREETARRAGDVALTYLPEGMEEIRRSGNHISLHIFFEDATGNTMRLTHTVIGDKTAHVLGWTGEAVLHPRRADRRCLQGTGPHHPLDHRKLRLSAHRDHRNGRIEAGGCGGPMTQ